VTPSTPSPNSKLSRFPSFFRCREIPNVGSVARDHLANERTFLAWSRTGMVFIGLGVALQEYYSDHSKEEEEDSPPSSSAKGAKAAPSRLGMHAVDEDAPGLRLIHKVENVLPSSWRRLTAVISMIAAGGATLTYGTLRYYHVQSALRRGMFPPNQSGILLLVVISASLTVGALSYVMQTEHRPESSLPARALN